MAFVLVQHLDPEHESILPALLARATAMPVCEVRDGMKIEPDHVYVIPSEHGPGDRRMARLKLLPRAVAPETAHADRPLLPRRWRRIRAGQRHRGRPLGDGVRRHPGAQAIKAAGGIVLAQDPRPPGTTACRAAPSLPGCVDAVLPPAGDRPGARAADRQHPISATPDSRPATALPADDRSPLDTIFTLLQNATGWTSPATSSTTLLRRIRRRMALHQVDGLADYASHLESHPAEVEALYQDMLINVTALLPRPGGVRSLAPGRLPAAACRTARADAPVRVWVPGCSTGEEAVLAGDLPAGEPRRPSAAGPSIQIFGTGRQRQCRREGAGRHLPGEHRRRGLARAAAALLRQGGRRLPGQQAVRDLCVFARQDLIRDPPFSQLDLISCRNVLIYLEPALQQRVMPIFHYALDPRASWSWAARRRSGASPTSSAGRQEASGLCSGQDLVGPRRLWPAAPARRSRLRHPRGRPSRPRCRRPRRRAAGGGPHLLGRFAPPGVVVNDDLEIVQFRGDTRPVPRAGPGEASLNLLRWPARGCWPGCARRAARPRQARAPVAQGGPARHATGTGSAASTSRSIPVQGRSSGPLCFLVLFDERRRRRRPAGPRPGASAGAGGGHAADAEIDRLEQELAATREYLQSIIEEQEAANEELQVRQRGDPVQQRGAAEHQRGAGDRQGGAPVHQRGADHPQRRAAEPQRGAGACSTTTSSTCSPASTSRSYARPATCASAASPRPPSGCSTSSRRTSAGRSTRHPAELRPARPRSG